MPTRDIHMKQINFDDGWLHFLNIYVSPLQQRVFEGYFDDVRLIDFYNASVAVVVEVNNFSVDLFTNDMQQCYNVTICYVRGDGAGQGVTWVVDY